MNFVRLVHVLSSISPYENGLIKQFKHKDQCTICNASPTYFRKFIFLLIYLFIFWWKTYLNLHLKWAMTFRSPHLFCFFFLFWIYLFLFFFLKKKMWSNFISTQQSLLLVPLQSLSWMFTLPPHEGLAPSFKSLIHFYLSFSNGPCPSSKSLVNWFKKISCFNPHWALGEPTHVFGF